MNTYYTRSFAPIDGIPFTFRTDQVHARDGRDRASIRARASRQHAPDLSATVRSGRAVRGRQDPDATTRVTQSARASQWRAYAVRVRASWRGECVCMAWLASSCFPAGSARAVAAAGSAAPAAAGASIGPAAIGPLTCSRLPARCRRRIRIRHPPRPKPRRHAYGALCMRAVQGDVRTYPDRSIARIIHSWFYSINHASHAITWGLGHCICIYMSRVVCVSTREAYRPDTTLQRPRRPLGNRKKNTQTGIHQTVL